MLELLAKAKERHVAGDIDGAKTLYMAVLKEDPRQADAWYHLGVICYQLRHYEIACQALQNAIAAQPDLGAAFDLLGSLCWDIGDFDRAIENLRRATQLMPENTTSWYHLGSALALNGELTAAAGAYWQVVRRKPDEFWAHVNLADILHRLAEDVSAELMARAAIEINPDIPKAWIVLTHALINQGRAEEAAEYVNKIIERWIDDNDAVLAVAEILGHWKAHDYASQFYRLILARQPDHPLALSRLVDIHLSLCEWQDYDHFVGLLTASLKRYIDEDKPVTVDIFNLHALPIPPAFAFAAAKQKSRVFSRQAEEKKALLRLDFATHRAAQGKDGRIRLGYLLPYTHRSSMPMALRNIIESHDRDRFEVVGYSLMACDHSEDSVGFRNAFDEFTYMVGWNPDVAARRIHADRIDLLIDTTGHTVVHGLDIMAYRPAPVSAHYLGYSLTSGSDFIDYLITDKRFMPPEWQAHCSEQLVYLPDSFMAPLRDEISSRVFTRADEGLPDTGFVFANFNHPCKFEPSIFDIWMRILKQVPGSVLWLCTWIPKSVDNLRREAEARGVSGERVVFAKRRDHPDHLKRLQLADLVLDNRFHGGGVTTLDALWAGVPVLSALGDRSSARLGATLLGAARVPELVVADLAEYERRAIGFADDPSSLAPFRARLAQSHESPLFDRPRYQRHLEMAYRMMWENHAAGQPPRRIEVPVL